MKALVRLAVLFVSISGMLAVGNVPKCDPAITSKMAGATGIISSIQRNGQYSYVVVSSDEASLLGSKVKCIGIRMAGSNKVHVSYKLSSLLALLPTEVDFPVKEENGVLVQQDTKFYKLYVMYMSDGVIFTYRCCDTCTTAKPNVGIAVANRLKDQQATKTALEAAKAKMKQLKLDSDVTTVDYCQ